MTTMRCNAGRNYIFVDKDGSTHRCRHRMEKGVDSSWAWTVSVAIDKPLECELCDTCKASHKEDYQRSSRYNEDTSDYDMGLSACDPRSQLTTMLNIESGKNSIDTGQWVKLIERFVTCYSLTMHTITSTSGLDPLSYKGIARIVEKMMFYGDRVYFMSNLSVKEPSLVDVLSIAKVSKVRFACVLDTTTPRFDWLKFLGRSRLIKERGFDINILYVANALQVDQFEMYRNKFLRYGMKMIMYRTPNIVLSERQEKIISQHASQDEHLSAKTSLGFEGL